MDRPYHYIIDLDGTIYQDRMVLPYAADFIRYLDERDRRYVFYTNCPERTPEILRKVLKEMGIRVQPSRIFTSGVVTIEYLLEQDRNDLSIYLIGSQAYRAMVRKAGITVLEGKERLADYVVVAFDKKFNYEKLRDACYHVEHGARLLATNSDETIPTPEGPVPHTGAILSAVEYASKRKALILGKPSRYSCQVLRKHLGCSLAEMCMVGDRLDTDMQFAKSNGFSAFLMLTGSTREEDLLWGQRSMYQEKFNDLSELIAYDKRITSSCGQSARSLSHGPLW